MKYSNLLFIAILLIGFTSCQKDASFESNLEQEELIETRKYKVPCNDPEPTDLDGLADIGGCYNPEWKGGELDKYINSCLIGDVALCQNFSGFEILDNYSSNPLFPGDYDINNDGIFSKAEQLSLIDDIMDIVDDMQPSCSSATLVSVDVHRDALINVAVWVCAKYMCCGVDKEM